MQPLSNRRQIGWDDITFFTPVNWETTVQGKSHLVCEENLQPLFELRWQKECKSQPEYKKECEKIGCTLRLDRLPKELEQLKDLYQITPYGIKGQKNIVGFFAYCSTCSTLIQATINSNNTEKYTVILKSLSSLNCHAPEDGSALLSIQDFSLMLPAGKNCMQSYTFQPGLSRVHLISAKHHLHICRLASAKSHLSKQSVDELLKTLCGTEDLITESNQETYYGHRTPSIPQQIILRMKRKKPFIRAAIRHIEDKDRLLTLFIESKKPIEKMYFDNIWNSYDLLS